MTKTHSDAMIVGGAFVAALFILFSEPFLHNEPFDIYGWIIAGIIGSIGTWLVVGMLKTGKSVDK